MEKEGFVMRVLFALRSARIPADFLSASMGQPVLMFFHAPAIAQVEERLITVPPDSLMLHTVTASLAESDLPAQAAFSVSFDPQDALWQKQFGLSLPLGQPVLLSAADAPPDAGHLQKMGEFLAEMSDASVPEPICTHLLYALLQACGNVSERRRRERERRHNRARLIALRQAIYENPMQLWSIEQMCVEVSVSRTHLHRIYHETFHVACHTDVLYSRLLHARMLLRSTDDSVREIALACGFENDVTFMRAFKKHQGCTPTTYRKEHAASS